LVELGAWPFIWWGFAFYGFMSWFAAIEAQIVVHVMLPFCKGKVASFLKFTLALGGIDLHIWRFFSGNFLDPSVQIMMWALRSFREVARSSIEAPVLIQISGLVNECR
jgi:hypothetical protein